MTMNISKREIMILGGLAVAAAIMYLFVLGPTAAERARLGAEAARLSRETQKITEALKAIPQGKEGLEEVRARFEKIRARLLPADGISTLFGEVSRPSKRLGVRIASFTPKGPDPAQHGQIVADLVLEGKYVDLGRYLEELSQGPILFSISDLKVQAIKSGDPSLRMNVVVKTWVRPEVSQ
jgi:Tfp pilus assembly protein PilO